MEWDREATARLERVPFFVRKKVKKQIEDFVASQGKNKVTSEDVSKARQQLAGGVPLKTGQGELTEAELGRITELIEKGVTIEGLNTKHIKFRVCGGAAGCPLTLMDLKPLAMRLADLAKEQKLEDFIAGSHDGPTLFHHQFKIALAGCPNNCSQPQIADFSVIGQAKPVRTQGKCNQCGLCVKACKEQSIFLEADGPVFNYDLCLNCGDCTRYCAKEAITNSPVRYQVLIGGKLGRHPHLALTVANEADWTTVEELFKKAIQAYKTKALDGERFADLVQRLGADILTN
jgi:anaerobic sulfite reductase subunit C